ncbi:type II toxin-antitoxin system Phd/YefM family antitoxin [Gloeocapsa sp. PCC 73106]|uniref:type II toxin-antitoxin system Phd/YefM family antitoxin n=1 Tax=Gloeocapsa sp. PCC 73106 TaxID=102232 RepID=UPI0002ACAC39|nr:type II toxin-antitoxin system Phd/YefM family antitoxin [Gloeocapsa sp. PCC 73106]ELR97543.1 prevent-host-death family protein [Gloeocapsa sp. PCC 73106]
MEHLSISKAQENLEQLIDQVAENHIPILIEGQQSQAVLISKEDWEAIQETFYLSSIPGFVESIKQAENSPREEWVNAKDLGLLD